jgi:hypothetical protein
MYKRWEDVSGSKRRLQYWLRALRRVKTWQLCVILIPLLFVAATFLRLNNLGMIERRDAVLAADKSGDKVKLQSSLIELQHYVSHHMNASLGQNGIGLQATYNRDYNAALAKAAQSGISGDIYQQANKICQAQGGSFNAYVQCVSSRVASAGQGSDKLKSAYLPQPSAYQYNFISPIISLDLAGLTTVLCLIVTGVILARLLVILLLRLILRWRKYQLK